MTSTIRSIPIVIVVVLLIPVLASAQEDRFQALANSPFAKDRPTAETAQLLKEDAHSATLHARSSCPVFGFT